MNIVFTGPACDSKGSSIVRADLTYACIEKGNLTVQPRVDHTTDVLVASRTDTVKAKGAVLRGIKVLTYPEFIALYLRGVEIKATAKPNGWVDKVVNQDLLVPVFIENEDLEKMDSL